MSGQVLSAHDYRSRIEKHLSGLLDVDLAAIAEDMVEARFKGLFNTGKLDNANETIKRLGTISRFLSLSADCSH